MATSLRALGSVGVRLDPAVFNDARQRRPAAQRMPDRTAISDFGRELRQDRFRPSLQIVMYAETPPSSEVADARVQALY